MTVALVTAAGIGSRMNMDIPKQFLKVHGKPIIAYTLEVLNNNPNIDSIIIACLAGWEKEMEQCVEQFGFHKVKWIVRGGQSGQESITNCLRELEGKIEESELVLVHDGNRPVLDDFVINESIRVALEHGGAVAAIPSTEAILRIDESHESVKSSLDSIDRDTIMRTQTPHTFEYGELFSAYDEIKKVDSEAVAPCTVMVALGKRVYFSPGSELNFKITTQQDLTIFTALLAQEAQDQHHA